MKKPLLIAATLALMVVFFTGCGAAGVEGGSKNAEEAAKAKPAKKEQPKPESKPPPPVKNEEAAAKTEPPPLTEADVDAMSDEEAVQMLNCQTQQVINDKGEKAGMDHVGDLWEENVDKELSEEGSGTTVQVTLSEQGYNCDELR